MSELGRSNDKLEFFRTEKSYIWHVADYIDRQWVDVTSRIEKKTAVRALCGVLFIENHWDFTITGDVPGKNLCLVCRGRILDQDHFSTETRAGLIPVRVIGRHPEDGEPIHVFEGRFGMYVSYRSSQTIEKGKETLNWSIPASIPQERVTLQQAVEWLQERKRILSNP